MKKLLLTAVVNILFTLLTGSVAFGQIAAFDFTGENTVATSTADSSNANLASVPVLTRGAGAAASAGANSFRTVGFMNNGIATTNTDYFQTTLSAASGYALSVTSLDAILTGTATFAASPGVMSQFAYSTDGVNFTLIGMPQTTIGVSQTLPTVDTSGIAALQNVPSGTTVTLRYYASGQTTTGGWGFFSPALGQNGFAIGGTVSPVLAASANVGGRVVDGKGNGIPRVSVMISGGELTDPLYATTNSFGGYSFDVPVGYTYFVTVSSRKYTFENPTQIVTVNDNITNEDFIAGER